MEMRAKPLTIAMAAAALVAACSGAAESDEDSSTPPDPATATANSVAATPTEAISCSEQVVVGVVADLSGGFSLFGSQLGQGIPIGFAYASGGDVQTGLEQTYRIDDCTVRVVFADDQSNPEVASIVAQQLVEDGAVVLIGATSQETTAAVQKVADDANVILIATSDTPTGLSSEGFDPNAFPTGPDIYQDAMAVCHRVVDLAGRSQLAQIAPDYGFGHRAAAAYRDACTALGAEFVAADVLAPAGTASFESVIAPIVAAGPDAVLLTWTGGGLKRLLDEANTTLAADGALVAAPFLSSRLMPAFFANETGMTSPTRYHYGSPTNQVNDYLVEQTAAVFGAYPDVFDAEGMTASLLVAAGLRAAGGATDAASLRAAMEGIAFEGPRGLVEIRSEDHAAVQDAYIVTLVNTDDPNGDYYDHVETVRLRPPCRLAGEFVGRCD